MAEMALSGEEGAGTGAQLPPQVNMPVNGGAEKLFGPLGKMFWTQFKTIGHSLKNLGPSQKTLRPQTFYQSKDTCRVLLASLPVQNF